MTDEDDALITEPLIKRIHRLRARPHEMKIVEGEIEVCDTCVNAMGYPVGWTQTWHESQKRAYAADAWDAGAKRRTQDSLIRENLSQTLTKNPHRKGADGT